MHETLPEPRFGTPAHLVDEPQVDVTPRFLGRAGLFDLWHGIDHEDDEVVVVAFACQRPETCPGSADTHEQYAPLEAVLAFAEGSSDLSQRAAREAARRAGWDLNQPSRGVPYVPEADTEDDQG